MAAISRDEVAHLARLSRLAVTDDELDMFAGQLDVILQAVARGLSNQAISKECWITEQTVKFHLTNIYRKLGVSSRTEAARYALSRGIAAA